MDGPVIRQAEARRASGWRGRLCHAVNFPGGDFPGDCSGVLDRDSIGRGVLMLCAATIRARERRDLLSLAQ